MNNISFKETAIDDYKIISDLYNYYIANSTATYHIKSLSAEEVVEFFQLREDTTFSFIIYMDDNFSGFCLLKQYSKKGGYRFTSEITIYLDKSSLYKGIGDETIKYLETVALKNGIKTIVAGICSENIPSIRLVEKNNYIKCGYFKKMGYKFDRFLDNVYYQKIL